MQPKENDTTAIEFTVLGKNMETISILYGLFLVVWGLLISVLSASQSMTSLIPSILGTPLVVLGFLALKIPAKKKLLMHIIVLIGLVIFLGGLDFLRGFTADVGPFGNLWAGLSKCLLMITGLSFTALCVKSFLFTRKNRRTHADE